MKPSARPTPPARLAAFAAALASLCLLLHGLAAEPSGPAAAFLESENEALAAFSEGDFERGRRLLEARSGSLAGSPERRLRLAQAYLRQAAYLYNQSDYETSYRVGELAAETLEPLERAPDDGLRAKALLCRADLMERFLHRPDEAARALRDARTADPEAPLRPGRLRRLESVPERSAAKIAAAKKEKERRARAGR